MTSGFQPKFTITHRIVAALSNFDRLKGFLEGAAFLPERVRETRQRAWVRQAHHTTRPEGTPLSLEQAARLWEGETLPEADARAARELLNYREAFRLGIDRARAGTPVGAELFRDLHRLLMQDLPETTGRIGAYRRVQNYVVDAQSGLNLFTPPPPDGVPDLMEDLVHWLNHTPEIHAVLVAGIAKFRLNYIHPFRDGNGRLARLFSLLWLQRCGYDVRRMVLLGERYDRDRGAAYAVITRAEQNGQDLTEWLEFFTEGLGSQLQEMKDYWNASARVDQLRREHLLSARQAGALELIWKNHAMNIRQYEAVHPGVSRRSLQRDLKKLVEIGLLQVEGGTHQTVYRWKNSA